MIYIGIDPGLTGALAILGTNGVPAIVRDLPTVAAGQGTVKNRVHGGLLALLLREMAPADRLAQAKAIVEQTSAMPGQGVASMFSMGRTLGTIEATLEVLGVAYEHTAPTRWKAALGLAGAEKDRSRTLALQFFPSLAPELARVKDHNRAEAVLLAHYLRNKLTGAK